MRPLAAITSDIDTLESIYKGQGCRPEGYSYAEFSSGLSNFANFLDKYQAPSTLFMVGWDFERDADREVILDMTCRGHELANHSFSHVQGFRHLSPADMEREIARTEDLCLELTGQRPVGFRSPGWNADDQVLPILLKRGYLYESSVFPTSVRPLLKFLHWWTQRGRPDADRTTMGPHRYLFAPRHPYRTGLHRLDQPGEGGLVEFPVTVTPFLRLPFFATFFASTGYTFFRWCLRQLVNEGCPIQFQFHLSDFVDYTDPDLSGQVPQLGKGQYVPKALTMSLESKLDLFGAIMDDLSRHYEFITLKDWSERIP